VSFCCSGSPQSNEDKPGSLGAVQARQILKVAELPSSNTLHFHSQGYGSFYDAIPLKYLSS